MNTSRIPFVAGNWKMNLTPSEAIRYLDEFAVLLPTDHAYEVALFPSYLVVPFVIGNLLKRRDIHVGAQNLSDRESGAFTGEVSAPMLTDAGCRYVLIGHSERRKIYGETDELLAKKLSMALQHKLSVVYCIGETLAEREANQTFDVIDQQLKNLIALPHESRPNITIAYEPVWAIGTGLNATPAQAQEVHHVIRTTMSDHWNDTGKNMRILYGGSVTPANAKELFACPDVDGGLVGGASLKPDSFYNICRAAE